MYNIVSNNKIFELQYLGTVTEARGSGGHNVKDICVSFGLAGQDEERRGEERRDEESGMVHGA